MCVHLVTSDASSQRQGFPNTFAIFASCFSQIACIPGLHIGLISDVRRPFPQLQSIRMSAFEIGEVPLAFQ